MVDYNNTYFLDNLEKLKETLANLNRHNQDLKLMKKMKVFLNVFNKMDRITESSPLNEKVDDAALLRKSLFIHEIGLLNILE